MTDIYNDDESQKMPNPETFKEKILRELEEAKEKQANDGLDFQSASDNLDVDNFSLKQDFNSSQSQDYKIEQDDESHDDTSRIDNQPDMARVVLERSKQTTSESDTSDNLTDLSDETVVLDDKDYSDTIVLSTEDIKNQLLDDKTASLEAETSKDFDSQNLSISDQTTKEDEALSRRNRKKTNKIANRISLMLGTLILVLLLATAFFGYRYVTSAIEPLDRNSTEFIQVEIPEGSGNKLIGQILEQSGVIKNGTIFNYYTKFRNYGNFQSGYYNLQKNMSLDDIAKALQVGGTAEPVNPVLGRILVLEGYTIKQISEAITVNSDSENKKQKSPFSSDDFIKVVTDEAFIARMKEKYPRLLDSLPEANAVKYRLEGYLFPATYNYSEDTTVENVVEEMIATMDSNLSPYYDTIAAQGLTVNQLLSLASLVEKEGSTDDDRKNIAGVFYNRWNIGMPLQSNIAILYAMDKLGEKTTLSEDANINTEIDSPYNIYRETGLTPGPVDSPSLSAIKATIMPAQTDYLYFVADVTTGQVYYATTFEEHSANVEKYVNSQLQ
ncbi:endolytic transglycosylase MltG [Streptococcus sp. CSL10205-OR2]|uniref:endolytic transglycosylase MltG n=1 Tax=Streptococcus sp. CSL10205-OR2 TaxID=2980558 RepID=UPI0021D9A86D|nr:endolytic transglycosylase MltG [Streptococcus sp. CSL10205-OR2]MCU9534220.1 endolytic transglycosylase MltG [Streptococcus sp. CSL10205-OR2]